MLNAKASWGFSEFACSHFFICLHFLLRLSLSSSLSFLAFMCMLLFVFPFLLFLHCFCVRLYAVWAVPPHGRWRGVCSCRTLWLSGSGIRRHPHLLNRLKSPSRPAVWYVEACHYMTDLKHS